jgi:hypothetical protein
LDRSIDCGFTDTVVKVVEMQIITREGRCIAKAKSSSKATLQENNRMVPCVSKYKSLGIQPEYLAAKKRVKEKGKQRK